MTVQYRGQTIVGRVTDQSELSAVVLSCAQDYPNVEAVSEFVGVVEHTSFDVNRRPRRPRPVPVRQRIMSRFANLALGSAYPSSSHSIVPL